MSLTKCPECTGALSDQATACPRCGHPGKPARIRVEDLDISLGSLIGLFVKSAIAIIPALLILVVLISFIVSLLSAIFPALGFLTGHR